MIPIYRYSLGRWALLCLLFVAGVALATYYYPRNLHLDNLMPTATASVEGTSDDNAFPCRNMVYSVSEDGVRYVRENGGGTVFAAHLNQRVSFYQVNPYGYMTPVDPNALDGETIGRLSEALLQCTGPWLPSGAWFSLSAKAEKVPQLN